MKKVLLFSALTLVSLFTYSQSKLSKDFSFTVGKPYEVIDAAEKNFYHVGKNVICTIVDGDDLTIQKFDITTLGMLKKIDVSDFPKGSAWEPIIAFNNKFLVFYNLYDKDKNTEQLFYRELNIDNMTFTGGEKLLCSVKGKITGSLYGKGWSFKTMNKFKFQYCYDSSKVMIQYNKKSANDDAHDTVGVMIYDKNFKQLWAKEVKMPYAHTKMENLKYSIDSEGNVYILTAVSDGSIDIKKAMRGKGECHMELLRIKAGTSEVTKTTVTIGKAYIDRIAMFESPKNYMVCAGFYSNTKEKNQTNVNGVYIFKAGKEGAIYDVAAYEIPLEILNQYASQKTQNKNEKKEEKGKAEFEDLEMENTVMMPDGSIMLIGEQCYDVTTTSSSSTGGGMSYTTYFYNDMLVTKIGADNKLEWMKKLPKRQKGSKGQGGLSFKYIQGKNNHYLLFLDNANNKDLTINDVPSFHVDEAGGFLTAYKVNDASGNVTKDYIFDTKDVKGMPVYQFKTTRILSISPTEFVIEVYKKGKEDVLIKITLKEE